jgi:HPt (histidine-containing phosphotransfer) domain-containing protein
VPGECAGCDVQRPWRSVSGCGIERIEDNDQLGRTSPFSLIRFWADAGGLLQELELALSSEDLTHASAVLHTLKGAAASLGLIGCSHACEEARTAIVEGDTPGLDALLTALFKTLQATQPRLVDVRDRRSRLSTRSPDRDTCPFRHALMPHAR